MCTIQTVLYIFGYILWSCGTCNRSNAEKKLYNALFEVFPQYSFVVVGVTLASSILLRFDSLCESLLKGLPDSFHGERTVEEADAADATRNYTERHYRNSTYL